MGPNYISFAEWHHAVGFARQACARVFRDGGSPADALKAFGLAGSQSGSGRWDKTVEAIAQAMCATAMRRAA